MCSSKPLDVATMALNPVIGIPMVLQKKQLEKQANLQKDAIDDQVKNQEKLKAQVDGLGPAAKAMDLTRDASVYEDIKRKKIAMQNGIMGTMKSNTMSAGPVATQKATLGT